MTPTDRPVSPTTGPTTDPTIDPALRGLAWGALGVVVFALTLPMTRLAVGDVAAPQLPPAFVTAGRAALAGLLAAAYLVLTGARRPPRQVWPALACSAAGTVVGFPLGLAIALREVAAMHAAVVTGVLPLATAVAGALAARQRPSAGFWTAAVAGCTLVLAFAAWQGGGAWVAADGWLALAVVAGAVGYVAGARAGAALSAPQVISWVLVGSLPLTLPATLLLWPTSPASAAAWAGFAYTGVFSMWLGFFAWYHGLALGGVLRVSQVQLLQPFLALIAAALLLGEPLDTVTVGFALAVLAVVLLGRRTRVAAR
jgi:drug/metabolite transporter (DMT)-like permease